MKDKQCCSTIIDPKTPLSMEKMEEKNYGRLVEEGGAKVFKSRTKYQQHRHRPTYVPNERALVHNLSYDLVVAACKSLNGHA
uniref:Uncharacterized protein n=1 Tax=Medicago truncatula TaxID=3880 RepID=Q2HVH0_MEDTR|nr:hypothetical protein MtrDRAFT_AC148819g14v2 [Medicago truncatula]